jgi:uncharacterized protein (DUF2345 family)
MTSDGKIDIYAADSINIHTENDLNVTAERDINFNATRDINMTAGRNTKITTAETSHINSGTEHRETAGKINMKGPEALKAFKPVRVPMTEPWAGHENLDPLSHKPDKTEAVLTPPELVEPEFFQKYTTVTDTFNKTQGAQ